MQEKTVFDTNIYIGIFNKGLYVNEVNAFNRIMYLAHPVLHELWMGARGNAEIRHLLHFGNTFIKLGRLIQPLPSTQVLIGRICNRLRSLGKLDPTNPRTYNDICISLLSRQVGATLVTRDIADFETIRRLIDFNFRDIADDAQ